MRLVLSGGIVDGLVLECDVAPSTIRIASPGGFHYYRAAGDTDGESVRYSVFCGELSDVVKASELIERIRLSTLEIDATVERMKGCVQAEQSFINELEKLVGCREFVTNGVLYRIVPVGESGRLALINHGAFKPVEGVGGNDVQCNDVVGPKGD